MQAAESTRRQRSPVDLSMSEQHVHVPLLSDIVAYRLHEADSVLGKAESLRFRSSDVHVESKALGAGNL